MGILFVYVIIDNKTMNYQNEVIVSQIMNHILQEFNIGLQVSQLLKHQSEYNAFIQQMTVFELIYVAQYPQPSQRGLDSQEAPKNIMIDNNATFRIEQRQIVKQCEQKQIEQQISKRQGAGKKIKKQNSLIVKSDDRGLFALSQPILAPNQSQLQEEITEIKNHMNFMRRLRKDYEDESRRRYEQIMNRKPQELPNKEYAFDFNGQFLFKKKPIFKKNFTVSASAKSEEIAELISKQTKRQSQEDPERDELISRGQDASREGKRVLYGNSGKRQVSHLPFIKLTQNSKLSQNLRSASGVDNSRYTFKSSQSRGEQTFKHYSEIEKERTERLSSLKGNNSKLTEATEEYAEMKPQTERQVRKQSKTMQKYLKKLCEDRSKQFVTQLNKSSNFDRINSPHEYSIHRYYKHNFDDDKKSICQSSLASLRLNSIYRSNLREIIEA